MDTVVIATCAVCGSKRNTVTCDTWFFVGGPCACKHVCSRECLVEFSKRLLTTEVPPLARLKQGNCTLVPK